MCVWETGFITFIRWSNGLASQEKLNLWSCYCSWTLWMFSIPRYFLSFSFLSFHPGFWESDIAISIPLSLEYNANNLLFKCFKTPCQASYFLLSWSTNNYFIAFHVSNFARCLQFKQVEGRGLVWLKRYFGNSMSPTMYQALFKAL